MLVPASAIPAFTVLHVVISLVAIATGFVAWWEMVSGRRLGGWTATFLTTTVATSVTGFGFPITGLTPGIKLGIVSLLVLPVAIYARYSRHLQGIWRSVYVTAALFAFYLNFVVLIVQSFKQLPWLNELAPHQTEPPFLVAQTAALVLFIVMGILALRRYQLIYLAPSNARETA